MKPPRKQSRRLLIRPIELQRAPDTEPTTIIISLLGSRAPSERQNFTAHPFSPRQSFISAITVNEDEERPHRLVSIDTPPLPPFRLTQIRSQIALLLPYRQVAASHS